jgi:hypothetical protein
VKKLPMLLVPAAIAAYSMSLALVTWVMISEIFPNRIRGADVAGCVLGFLFILVALPKTKGKTLEQTERDLVGAGEKSC